MHSQESTTSRLAAKGAPTPLGGFVWQKASFSPQPAPVDVAFPPCGDPDAALARVAHHVAERQVGGAPQLDSLELAFALRAEGAPYVWPHTWTLLSPDGEPDDVPGRVQRFLAGFTDSGVRRCGTAAVRGKEGGVALAVIVTDALADLTPLPTRARVGQWLHFDATMRVPSTFAKVVVLGPSGAPRTVPTTLHDNHVQATWSVDHEGPWTAQLVATVSGGPRPVLEALTFADAEPPATFSEWPAPGELDAPADAASALLMVNGARTAEGEGSLRGDPRLDVVAADHARAMKAARALAHDLGDGTPVERLARKGLEPRSAGENVAHALTLRRAHRALWASPSHRGNLLDPRFDSVGIGIATDEDGSLWLCEVFAHFGQTGNGM